MRKKRGHRRRVSGKRVKLLTQESQQAITRVLGFLFIHFFVLRKNKHLTKEGLIIFNPSFFFKLFQLTSSEKFVIKCAGSIIPEFVFEHKFNNEAKIVLIVRNGYILNSAKTNIKKTLMKKSVMPKQVNVSQLLSNVPVTNYLINSLDTGNKSKPLIKTPTIETKFNINKIDLIQL